MKADLAPKFIQNIDDALVLWFQQSNRYVICSESLYSLINIFLNVESQSIFIQTLKETFQIDIQQSESIYNEISSFLEDAHTASEERFEPQHNLEIPKNSIPRFYFCNNTPININFESVSIEGLIHPQIAHLSTEPIKNPSVTFDIFKTNDNLHLFKDKNLVGSYKTSAFHFLQGKFALELTNIIHNKTIENWIATFHASTISNGEEAIMIIGNSGNGKSTLSALLMANGFDLLADDFTPLYEDMNLYRYPAAISIKKGAFNTLESYIDDFNSLKVYSNGPKKVNLKYLAPALAFDSTTNSFKCQKIVYVKFDASETSELKKVPLENILATLIPESWISPTDKHARQFLNWLKNMQCFELTYSNNDFAITNFKALFNS